tara:strand:- start:1529 stop:3019 length:1491 start_codon:yes stop_codon:yes gene_type:complete
MVTIIANQLDTNYSQLHINALYTQVKKVCVNPFEFYVFVNDDEYKLLESTHKKDGYIDGITFHVPKYGKDWLEIDIMQHTKPGGHTLFITPNCIINNIQDIDIYKSNKKIRLQDGNLGYFVYRNDKVESILKEWDENEDELLYEYDIFSEKFLIEEGDIPFIKDVTASYPETTEEPIVVLPYWYEDFTEEQKDLMYNRATDLYPYLPERVEIELSDNKGNQLSLEQIRNAFSQDFMEKAHMKRIKFKGLDGDPTSNEDLVDISHYLMGQWGIGIDLISKGDTHDPFWWGIIGELYKDSGNITFNINTGNPDSLVLMNADILLKKGCRVFWSYTHTNQLNTDIEKAREISKKHNFTGFVYIDEVPEEVPYVEEVVKEEMPDYKLIELETLQTRKKDDIYKERKIKFAEHVKCEGKVNNQFYLSAKGNIFPCKHVALNVSTADSSPEHKTELLYDWNKNNIRDYSLEEIFTNDFYKGYFNNLLKLNPIILHNEQEGIC